MTKIKLSKIWQSLQYTFTMCEIMLKQFKLQNITVQVQTMAKKWLESDTNEICWEQCRSKDKKIKLEGGKGVLQKTRFVVDTNTLIIIYTEICWWHYKRPKTKKKIRLFGNQTPHSGYVHERFATSLYWSGEVTAAGSLSISKLPAVITSLDSTLY